jgi:hypothetical protein
MSLTVTWVDIGSSEEANVALIDENIFLLKLLDLILLI